MAAILDLRTVGNQTILVVDSNPASGAGTPAEVSSLAMLGLSSTGHLYQKVGQADTDWVEIANNGSYINPGVAGHLAIYQDAAGPTSGTQLDDNFIQNTQNLAVAIVAQPARSAGITYYVPNPGDAITSADFVLTEGNQTINGNKTFSGDVTVDGNLDINGTLTTIDTVNLQVTDKLITLNRAGAAGSGSNSGIEIEEAGVIQGYIQTNATRNGWLMKVPASAGSVDLRMSGLTGNRVQTVQDFDGVLALQRAQGIPGQISWFNPQFQLDNATGVGSSSLHWDAINNRLGIGNVAPARTLDVSGASILRGDFRLEDANGTNFEMVQSNVNTTAAAATVLDTIPTAPDSVLLIEARIVAKRTGGSAGTAGDCATYIRTARVKNIGGSLSIHSVDSMYTSEDVFGWNVTFSISGSSVNLNVAGAANTNIVWNATTKIQSV